MLQRTGGHQIQSDLQSNQDLVKSPFSEIQHSLGGAIQNVTSSSPYHSRPPSSYYPHPTHQHHHHHHHPHQNLAAQMDMGAFGAPSTPSSRTPTLGYQFQMAPPSGYSTCVPAHLFAMNGYQTTNQTVAALHQTRDCKLQESFSLNQKSGHKVASRMN